MKDSEGKEKIINSNNKDILNEITKELNQIIKYIQINLMNIKNKKIDFDEKEIQNKKIIKLGVKRKRLKKRLRKINKNEENKDKNEINLNENEDNEKINLKNKKLKAKIKKFKRHANEIIKKVKDILLKIGDSKNINLEEFNINSVQELNYENGKYIGNVHNG